MRKTIFGVACSLDNFIARPDGGVDWLRWTDEVADYVTEFWQTIDTVIMGRKTYEAALQNGIPAYPGVKNYVFSRQLEASAYPKVEIVSADAAEFVRSLKKEEGRSICVMGGGELGRSLLEAGLIDEVGLNLHPVLLGTGIPLFYEMAKQIDLELIEVKPFQTGCVVVSYRVLNKSHI